MSYWILTQKGTVISRTTVQNITALEKQTDSFKEAIQEFDTAIKEVFKEDADFGVEGSKPSPEDWAEYMEFDKDFQAEFDNLVNDPKVPEADKDFDPDVYDDTYVNM